MMQLPLRLEDALHSKIRVLAALKNTSMNNVAIEALQEKVDRWEQKYGALPTPPEAED